MTSALNESRLTPKMERMNRARKELLLHLRAEERAQHEAWLKRELPEVWKRMQQNQTGPG